MNGTHPQENRASFAMCSKEQERPNLREMQIKIARYQSLLPPPVTFKTSEKASVGKVVDQGELVQQFWKVVWHSLVRLDVCTLQNRQLASSALTYRSLPWLHIVSAWRALERC